jgi:hypothetical protein
MRGDVRGDMRGERGLTGRIPPVFLAIPRATLAVVLVSHMARRPWLFGRDYTFRPSQALDIASAKCLAFGVSRGLPKGDASKRAA